MQKTEQSGHAAEREKAEQESSHSAQYSDLSLLVIGTEVGAFRPESEAGKRIHAYGKYFKEVHIVVVSAPHDFPATSIGNVHLYPAMGSRFMRIVRAFSIVKRIRDIDVVTAQDPFENGLVAWRAARFADVPLHLQIHTDFLSPAFEKLSAINRIRVVLAKFLLKRADRIRVVSDRIRVSLQKLKSTASVTVLPIFVDAEKFKHASKDTELESRFAKFNTKLLVVSRLESEKNVARALAAFKESAPPDACLVIVGEGREKASLEQLAKRYDISYRVFFEGKQDPISYYKLADLVLFPSTYDGYGMVVAEALASGKPVLATNVGAARELGAIVADEKNFSQALKEWFTNGPRTGELKSYPYRSFEEYVRAYCKDITATLQ